MNFDSINYGKEKFNGVRQIKKNMENNHLSIIGPGPAICLPMVLLTVIGVWVSAIGAIPGNIDDSILKMIMLVLGMLLIIEGIVLYFCADLNGNLVDSIKENKLKTNGSYRFVRNPCYCMFLLGTTGVLLISHNWFLLVLPLVFYIEMTVVLINTEEKWLKNLYGQDYVDYCKRVNRCIPWWSKD